MADILFFNLKEFAPLMTLNWNNSYNLCDISNNDPNQTPEDKVSKMKECLEETIVAFKAALDTLIQAYPTEYSFSNSIFSDSQTT